MAGAGGGAWKVAYADFVTAMMAFFMVMWIIGQNKPVKQAIAQYFKDPRYASSKPTGPTSLLPPGKQSDPSRERPKTGILRGPKNGKGIAAPEKGEDPGSTTDRAMLQVLHNANHRAAGTLVLFTAETSELDDAAKKLLKRLTPALLGKPNRIEIRGRAARRSAADDMATWQVCYARCMAVKDYLEAEGIEPERIRLSQAGVHEPVSRRGEPEKQAQNSSVELYLLDEFVDTYADSPAPSGS